MKHDSEFIAELSRATGMSRRTVRRGLDDLVSAGFLVRDQSGAYIASINGVPINDEPPADQAGGSLISLHGSVRPSSQTREPK